jgi:hypothetical protein
MSHPESYNVYEQAKKKKGLIGPDRMWKSFRDAERERKLREHGPNPHERGDGQATGNVRGAKQDFGGYDDPRLRGGYGFNLGE